MYNWSQHSRWHSGWHSVLGSKRLQTNTVWLFTNLIHLPRRRLPPLEMVDAAVCGPPSAPAVAHRNAQTNLKKLQYGIAGCVQKHVGCQSPICPNNYIDTWTVESNTETMPSFWDLVDKEAEKHCMEKLQVEISWWCNSLIPSVM